MSDRAPISVIIPILNSAATLPSALESVLSQLPAPAEVICIDGGSTDTGVEIARSFGVQVIGQEGLGLARARNQAVLRSREPWIAFCDGDDRWAAGALAVRLQALAANPEVDVIIGRVVREMVPESEATAAQERLIGRPVRGFTPGAMIARRRVFAGVGAFDEALTIGADSDWFVRLQDSGWVVAHLDEVVLFKGVRATSLSADVPVYRRELLTIARRFIERQRGGVS